jgi:hypothetical protein
MLMTRDDCVKCRRNERHVVDCCNSITYLPADDDDSDNAAASCGRIIDENIASHGFVGGVDDDFFLILLLNETVVPAVFKPQQPKKMTMIIPIRAATNESTEKVEWVMLELNGELLKPLDDESSTSQKTTVNNLKRRVELGSVKFDSDGAPTLIIGNHELKGTAIILKEPFAVLRKRRLKQIYEHDDLDLVSGESPLSKSQHCKKTHLEVVGIVKKKLMFDQYPKSMMR